MIINAPKDIRVSASTKKTEDFPLVVVTAVSLKTIINEKKNVNEIVSASVVCCAKAKVRPKIRSTAFCFGELLSCLFGVHNYMFSPSIMCHP